MRKLRKVIAMALMSAVVIAGTPAFNNDVKAVTINSDAGAITQWQTNAITSPVAGKLVPAGYVDIKWTSANDLGEVKGYKVYVDDALVNTATATTTQFEFYTTTVSSHKTYIVAEFTDGSSVTSSTFYFYVTKKGLCVNDKMGKMLIPDDMNIGWYYNWGVNPFTYSCYTDIDYVPMIWGTSSEKYISSIVAKGYKYLLAYNEPDMGANAGGSNINVNTAIKNWSNFLGNNYYLGSPAPAYSPSWGNGTWFRTFMNGIDQSTIDFIPLHCYYKTYGGVEAANDFLTDVVDKTYQMYHKPIWITEFAPSGWGYSDTNGRKKCKEFLEAVLKGLDERSYVERYSWFSFDTTDGTNGAAALWTNKTGVLTDLGNAYVANGNPEGYSYGNCTAVDNTTMNVVYATSQAANDNNKSDKNNEKVVKPGKAGIISVKSLKKKTAKIRIKKVAKAKGYQIKYSDSKKFIGYLEKSTSKTTVTIKKLDRKTKFYFKVRAYTKVGTKKVYGAWSKTKSVKVK
ncbi:glycosyl hydrolase [Eubacterium sp. CAG:156]|uniref:glycosyl hydrolase n=1 Tax=Eubacterium sp. CAG:156 TaxID=1262880 RepID=UPI0032674E86